MIEEHVHSLVQSEDAAGEKACGCGPDCRCGDDCACGPAGKCAPACGCAE